MILLCFGFVAAWAMEFRTDPFTKGELGQVIVFPATTPKDAHWQAFCPQEHTGVFPLLYKDKTEAEGKDGRLGN